MAVLILLATIAGCVLARHPSDNTKPVPVTIFYETLCPSCRQFIPTELLPTYTDTKFDFASLISELTLVPYGWVDIINATAHDYKCQHGENECEGNKLHGCAIKYIPDLVTTLKYISCLENKALADYNGGSSKYPVNKCKNKLPEGIYPQILNCYNTNEGWELFKKNGEITNSFFKTPGFVPYVSFNHERNDLLADDAVDDFRKTLCKVTGVIDKACSS